MDALALQRVRALHIICDIDPAGTILDPPGDEKARTLHRPLNLPEVVYRLSYRQVVAQLIPGDLLTE